MCVYLLEFFSARVWSDKPVSTTLSPDWSDCGKEKWLQDLEICYELGYHALYWFSFISVVMIAWVQLFVSNVGTFVDYSVWIVFPSQVENQAAVQTFASPTFSSFLDMLLCCLVVLALSLACFLRPLVTHQSPSTPALILTSVAALLEAVALLFAIRWDTKCISEVFNREAVGCI